MIKPLEMLVEVRERRLPMLAYREFLGDLMIAYVIDEERSVAYINEEHLDRWSVSVQDLHERAIENLDLPSFDGTIRVTWPLRTEGEPVAPTAELEGDVSAAIDRIGREGAIPSDPSPDP